MSRRFERPVEEAPPSTGLRARLENFTPFRERNPIFVGLVSVGVLAVAVLFALSLNRFTFLRGMYVIRVDFADASGLTTDNEVRVAGLKVGKVRSVELGPSQGSRYLDRVRVTMEISSDVQLGDASEAEIKLKTLLGTKFVDVTPKGGAPYVAAGQIIPLERTRVPFELYEITNRTVQTLGEIDAKALNSALRELATLTDDPNGNFGRALRGLAKASEGLSDHTVEVQKLLRSGGRVLEALGSRSDSLARILDRGSEVLTALSQRRDALRRFVTGSDRLATELTDLIRSNRASLDPALRRLHIALEVVRKDIGPLEHAVKVLGPDAKSFGKTFTQGTWGDVWVQTIFDLTVPPILPVGAASVPGSTTRNPVADIFLGAMS